MDVVEAIRTRRSWGKMLPDAPPRQVISRLLDAAAYAPNHHNTRPWRFVVLAGEARERLGMAQEAALRRTLADPDAERNGPALAKERGKPLRAPVVVVAAVEPSTLPKVAPLEETGAVAAAIQNLLLAAHAEGLAAIWRTGDTSYSPEVKAAVGLPERAELLGLIYLGYPDLAQPPKPRPAPDLRATWLGWDA